MALNENIVTGRKFKKLIDEANNLWQKMSFWTKASDIEFDDGATAEIKIGAINGVTDSLTSTSSNIAASAAAVKALNDKVTELNSNITPQYTYQTLNLEFGADSTLTKTAYTSFPNKALGVSKQSHAWGGKTRYNISVTGNTITYSRDASTSNVSTCLSVTFIGY